MAYFNKDLIPAGALEYFLANPNVLVIDDDRSMWLTYLAILEEVGFNVTTATDGIMGLKKVREQPVDFIILDYFMPPGLNGFEVYQRLQADPQTQHIPVMVTTSWADTQFYEQGQQLGIRHLLPVPFTEDELLEAILALLIHHFGSNFSACS